MNNASFLFFLSCLLGSTSHGLQRAFLQSAETGASAPSAPTSEEDNPKVTYYLCKLGRQVRSLRVDISDSGCKAYYTKQGVDQEVGKSGEKDLCFKVTNRIRRNLESGDWKCQDVSASRKSFH